MRKHAETKGDLARYRRILARQQRARNFGLAVLIILALIVTTFLIIRILGKQKASPRYVFLTNAPLAVEVETDALIVRSETVYPATATGSFHSFVPQGSKVAKGKLIGQIVPSGKEETLLQLAKADNDVVDRRYELLAQGKGGVAGKLCADSKAALGRSLSVFYDYLLRKDTSKTLELEADLKLIIDQRSQDLLALDFHDDELERLLSYKQSLENLAADYIKNVYAQEAGILIYNRDGLEDTLPEDVLLTLSKGDLDQHFRKTSFGNIPPIKQAQEGEPLYKLSRSIDHYFILNLPSGYGTGTLDGSTVRLVSASNGATIRDLVVLRAEEGGSGTLVVLKSNSGVEAFCGMRKDRVKLYLQETVGLRVPRQALLNFAEGNSEADIFLVAKGYVRRCKVKVTEYNQEFALIAALPDSEFSIDVSTMVLTNPEVVKEDDAIADAS